jgi:hypothetical protein
MWWRWGWGCSPRRLRGRGRVVSGVGHAEGAGGGLSAETRTFVVGRRRQRWRRRTWWLRRVKDSTRGWQRGWRRRGWHAVVNMAKFSVHEAKSRTLDQSTLNDTTREGLLEAKAGAERGHASCKNTRVGWRADARVHRARAQGEVCWGSKEASSSVATYSEYAFSQRKC